jgi:hypothetical protein
MTLFTQVQTKKLLANCREQIVNNDAGHSDIDFKPVVKLFTPDAQRTWLLTELGNDDIAYGLCDLGMGTPERGYVCMREIRELRGPLGLSVERDLHFHSGKTLSAYPGDQGLSKTGRLLARQRRAAPRRVSLFHPTKLCRLQFSADSRRGQLCLLALSRQPSGRRRP